MYLKREEDPSLYNHTSLMLLSQIYCLVCSKSVITHTHTRDTAYLFEIMQAWVLSDFPQIKHMHKTTSTVFIHRRYKVRNTPVHSFHNFTG